MLTIRDYLAAFGVAVSITAASVIASAVIILAFAFAAWKLLG